MVHFVSGVDIVYCIYSKFYDSPYAVCLIYHTNTIIITSPSVITPWIGISAQCPVGSVGRACDSYVFKMHEMISRSRVRASHRALYFLPQKEGASRVARLARFAIFT